MWFLWNDKLDGYPILAQNPTGTGMNFYPWLWVLVQIFTRSIFTDGQVTATASPNGVGGHYAISAYCIRQRSEGVNLNPITTSRPLSIYFYPPPQSTSHACCCMHGRSQGVGHDPP
jgi:hypothetical protein